MSLSLGADELLPLLPELLLELLLLPLASPELLELLPPEAESLEAEGGGGAWTIGTVSVLLLSV